MISDDLERDNNKVFKFHLNSFFENIPLPLKAMPCELSPIFKALTLNKQWGRLLEETVFMRKV